MQALQTAAYGKPGHSAKHSYSLSDLASQDFDPNLPIEKVQDGATTGGGSFPHSRSRFGFSRQQASVKLGERLNVYILIK